MIDIESPVWAVLVAPFVGSFMGVLVLRLPAGAPVVFARSACPHCATPLSAWEMVPFVSFALLRGRCRHCREAIGLLHPGIEIGAACVAVWAALAGPERLWLDCGLGWTLVTLACVDYASFLLPDVLTLPLLLAGLTLTLVADPAALADHCLAAVAGYSSFQGLALGYRWLRGRDGLGGGDAKLIAAAGAWCGLAWLPFVVLSSAVVGLIVTLGLATTGRAVSSTTRIPFGPCIALAFWLVWMHGGLFPGVS